MNQRVNQRMQTITTTTLRSVWLVAVIGVIFGSVLPRHCRLVQFIDNTHMSDKLEHLGAYAVLGAFPMMERFRCRHPVVIISFLCALGVVLEVAQRFSPGRSCEWNDFVADCLGLLAGAVLVRIFE